MSRIRIKNFGPIQAGYLENEGWLDMKKITVFVGNQGSGKSAVAKLFSTMSWIEKAMVIGSIRQDDFTTYRFEKRLAYQRIEHYITPETSIEYTGKAFSFTFKDGNFELRKSEGNGYLLPKIMYAPAERNFLSSVDRPDKLKNLPSALYTFNDEFDAAKNLFSEGVGLPISNVRFEYDKLNNLAHIVGGDKHYRLRLSEASSGFQSSVPLFLVTKYLSDGLVGEEDRSFRENSLEEQKKLDEEIKAILGDPRLTPDVKQAYLRLLSTRRKRACLINIVEEPEQNLFPLSQGAMLNSLLVFANMYEGNKLIMTTHSPYIINYLSIAIYGATVLKNIKSSTNRRDLLEKLETVVPEKAVVAADDVAVYQMDEMNGTIDKLPQTEGVPSDQNYLNQSLRHGNRQFDKLLEIEEEL